MNIVDEIVGFFTRIFRGKVTDVQNAAKAKLMSAEVRAKSKVANAVDQKLKQGAQAAKAKVAPKPPAKK